MLNNIMRARSNEIEELAESTRVSFSNIRDCAKALLAVQPSYNAELHRQMGIGRVGGARSDYIAWALLQNDPSLQKTEQNEKNRKKNIMVNHDIVEAFNARQISAEDVVDIIRRDVHANMEIVYENVRSVIYWYPEIAYNARIAEALDCSFYVMKEGRKTNKDMATNYILKMLVENGDIEDPEKNIRKPEPFEIIWYVPTGVDSQYEPPVVKLVTNTRRNSSLGEAQAAHILNNYFARGIRYVHQKTFPRCRNNKSGRLLPFDFQVFHVDDPDNFILVEIDGEQHYTRIKYFHATEQEFADQQARDMLKNKYCIEENILLVRIRPSVENISVKLSVVLGKLLRD